MMRTRRRPEWLQVFHSFTETPYVLEQQLDELRRALGAPTQSNGRNGQGEGGHSEGNGQNSQGEGEQGRRSQRRWKSRPGSKLGRRNRSEPLPANRREEEAARIASVRTRGTDASRLNTAAPARASTAGGAAQTERGRQADFAGVHGTAIGHAAANGVTQSRSAGSERGARPTDGASPTADQAQAASRRLYTVVREAGYATSVIDAYKWDPVAVERWRTILRVETKTRAFALKRTHISGQHVEFLRHMMLYAKDRGFDQFAPFEKSRRGRPYATRRNEVYYVTPWVDGQQANFSSAQQVRLVARTLARLHESTRGFDPDGFQPKPVFQLAELLRGRTSDLHALLARAEDKKDLDAFDETLLDLGESLRRDAADSVEIAAADTCLAFLAEDAKNPGVCHLDVIPQNIVYDTDKRMVLLDFDLSTYAPRVLDLGHLLRRCLHQSYWNEDLAYTCFVEYNDVRPMTAAEYRLVLALLRFPHRAWRLARARYQQCADSVQIDELRSLRAQEEQRQRFLSDLAAEIDKVKT